MIAKAAEPGVSKRSAMKGVKGRIRVKDLLCIQPLVADTCTLIFPGISVGLVACVALWCILQGDRGTGNRGGYLLRQGAEA